MNAQPGMKKLAASCILRHKQSFMLLKRNKEPYRGMFLPVGGKVDPFESPRNAAVRETREETGLKVDRIKFCGTLVETSPREYNWMSFIYLYDIDHIPPPASDEGVLEWVSFDQLLEIPTPKTDWYIYQYIMQGKPFAFNADFDQSLTLIEMTEEFEEVTVYREV